VARKILIWAEFCRPSMMDSKLPMLVLDMTEYVLKSAEARKLRRSGEQNRGKTRDFSGHN
jgi:hypothetical protein